MTKTFDEGHPEQVAYDNTCSIWLTEGTSDREKYAYRDGHHAGWMNASRKPLTKEEIRAIEIEVAKSPERNNPSAAETFARAIERAHGIGA